MGLDETGNLYSWGSSKFGVLGINTSKLMKDHTDDPTRLDTYNKSNVKNKVKNFYYQSFTIGNSENRLKFDYFPPFI